MLYFSGKGCSEFPKKVLILIGILRNRGIGLRYVKAMLESFYEGETNLFVNCKKGYGTKITILIPIQEELRNKIKFTGSETEKEGMEK